MMSDVVSLHELLLDDKLDGAKATAISNNVLFNITFIRDGNTLINERTGKPALITKELLQSKFKLVNEEKEVTINEMLQAYQQGKKIKIEFKHYNRYIQRQTYPVCGYQTATSTDKLELLTIDELMYGKFYIVEE